MRRPGTNWREFRDSQRPVVTDQNELSPAWVEHYIEYAERTRTHLEFSRKSGVFKKSDAQNDAELQHLLKVWPNLPDHVKSEIMQLAKSTGKVSNE